MIKRYLKNYFKNYLVLSLMVCGSLTSVLTMHGLCLSNSMPTNQEQKEPVNAREQAQRELAQIIALTIKDADVGRTTPLTEAQKAGMARLLEAQFRTDGDGSAVIAAVQEGARFYMRGTEDDATLFWAVMVRDSDLVRYLLNDEQIRNDWLTSDKGVLLCIVAFQSRRIDIIEALLAYIDDVNIAINGITLLMAAAEVGSVPVVRLLLNKGASIDTQNKEHRTALFFAVSAGHLDVVKLLVQNGADTSEALSYLETASSTTPRAKRMITVIKEVEKERQAEQDKQWYATAGTCARFRYDAWRALKRIAGYE